MIIVQQIKFCAAACKSLYRVDFNNIADCGSCRFPQVCGPWYVPLDLHLRLVVCSRTCKLHRRGVVCGKGDWNGLAAQKLGLMQALRALQRVRPHLATFMRKMARPFPSRNTTLYAWQAWGPARLGRDACGILHLCVTCHRP